MDATDTFDLERLRANGDSLRTERSKRPPRHQPGEKFLKGPIPWEWLRRAGCLPGSALHVALILWFEAGLRNRRDVPFSLSRLKLFGKSAGAARSGLRALKSAGLITIQHRPGHALDVTLLDAPVV